MLGIFAKLFDSNEKQLKKAQPIIDQINQLEPEISKLSDVELRQETDKFRKILKVDLATAREQTNLFENVNKQDKQKELDRRKAELEAILPRAFAVVREASKRVTNHRHFDVQLMAGYFLFTNKIVEVMTGEGKTLSANLPLYMYALTGKGAHLITVNDYLARRDAEWNGHILSSLGITVGVINNDKQYIYVSDEEAILRKGDAARKLIEERKRLAKKAGFLKYDHMNGANLLEASKKEVYACDVVYGTNSEFGFDYLRDNMAMSLEERVQGPLHYAIVDEADSILIDEARTPLIISQSVSNANDLYVEFARVVDLLHRDVDYEVDEKAKSVLLTSEGIKKAEKLLNVKNIYENALYAYHLDNALKAKELYHRDDQYMIRNGEVLIVDEFTGRVLPGRRYSEGLHQAIEAKEGVEIKQESRTLATITLQNYFRLYDYVAGMTGTALTEAEEFSNIYHLDTIVVPTNKPVIREDLPDVVFRTMEGKFKAIVQDIKEHHEKGQPVLVGTTSIEKSEVLSDMLKKEGVPHNVLNAKYHEREAKIVAQAGQRGAVTIATNMAGRGTDIALGEGVVDLGGLYVIGSERHESRRIDNQLRGRSGRQGDPGKTRFYISFEDDLLRLYSEKAPQLLKMIGMDDDMPVSASLLGKAIENAQKKVEAYNFDIRKQLVEYDDVLNQQREIIYGLRRRLLVLASKERNINPRQLSEEDVKKFLKKLDIDRVLASIDAFKLNDETTWSIDSFADIPEINNPLNVWILKHLINYTRNIIAVQLEDDMKIDNVEERQIIESMVALLNDELVDFTSRLLGYKSTIDFYRSFDKLDDIDRAFLLLKFVISAFIVHVLAVGPVAMKEFAKMLVLQTIDQYWMDHLSAMTDLREGIGLRSVAQKDPLVEYKNAGFEMFEEMIESINMSVVKRLFKIKPVEQKQAPVNNDIPDTSNSSNTLHQIITKNVTEPLKQSHKSKSNNTSIAKRGKKKVGRNDPCPCGSGKKYKKCCYPKYS